ncbi:hypothetical protein F4774DRAFT_423362 [Daldinia eschscholtzii]|nr:hypothetical protein F4774DRAFT_423362 [Daldinia eschscholtzii]
MSEELITALKGLIKEQLEEAQVQLQKMKREEERQREWLASLPEDKRLCAEKLLDGFTKDRERVSEKIEKLNARALKLGGKAGVKRLLPPSYLDAYLGRYQGTFFYYTFKYTKESTLIPTLYGQVLTAC